MTHQFRLEKILFITAAALFAVIALGTILSFVSGKAQPGARLRRSQPPPVSSEAQEGRVLANGKTLAYTGLGQLRVSLAGNESEEDAQIVLISPWFLYPADDAPFYEEISAKNRKLKLLFSVYFSKQTMADLVLRGEAQIKTDLLALINGELTLGKISELFFDEYIFFD